MKLYVPNPQMWVDFFDRVGTGKASLNQSGAGRRPRVITIDQSKPLAEVSIKAVLSIEQTVAQAKSEMKREDISPEAVEKMFQSTSRHSRKRKSRTVSLRKNKRRRGTKKVQTGGRAKINKRHKKTQS